MAKTDSKPMEKYNVPLVRFKKKMRITMYLLQYCKRRIDHTFLEDRVQISASYGGIYSREGFIEEVTIEANLEQ